MKDNKRMGLWVENYRPDNLDGYIGNDVMVSKFKSFIDAKDLPHLLLYGPAGTGKTTLAKILVNNIECDYLYINASDKGGVDYIRTDIIPFASSLGFNDFKIVILDEADFSTPSFQAALRNTMEQFSAHTRFILTCNYIERVIDPIKSRCQTFQLHSPARKDVAKRLKHILDTESITYDVSDIVSIVNSNYPDIRKCINVMQQNSNTGKLILDKAELTSSNWLLQMLELLSDSKINPKTAYTKTRELISENQIKNFTDVYRFLYDNINEYAQGHGAPVILMLCDGQVNDTQVIDKEIVFMSTLIKIINQIKQ